MGQFITPPTIPSDTYCRRILIPNTPEWIGTVTGALLPLIYSSEWVQTTGISPDEAAERALQMFNEYVNSGNDGECGDMACCDDKVKQYRVDPVTGNIQLSTNGGATWGTPPNGLQSVIVEPIPPVTSGVSATKCDAATNVKEQVQVWIDQVSNDFETATSLTEFATGVFAAILAALLILITGGAITPLEALVIPAIGGAISAAWTAGKVAFDNYWTTEIKDKILCAAYCNIGDDGSFSEAQFSAFWTKVNADLPASPAKMLFMGFLSSSGKAGLNAMAATGLSADADCADCHCEGYCVDQDFTVSNGDWYNIPRDWGNPAGQWTLGQGWMQTYMSHSDKNNELFVASPVLGCPDGHYDFHVVFAVDNYYGNDVSVKFTVGDGGGDTTNLLGVTGVGLYARDYLNWPVTSLADISFNCTSNACDYRIVSITMALTSP